MACDRTVTVSVTVAETETVAGAVTGGGRWWLALPTVADVWSRRWC